jgi:hypothetical protein
MIRFTQQIQAAWLIGLAALALAAPAAHGQGRPMRMRQGMMVRQPPRNFPMMNPARSFFVPRQFGSDPFVARRFDRLEDRFERGSAFRQFDRFEDRLERRFGFNPFFGTPFGFNPLVASPFGFNPFLISPFGLNPFLGL